MVKQPIGIFEGRQITFCQCESQEEATREGLPQGMYSFWEDDAGKRILSPGTIVMMAQKAAIEGKSISDLISPQAVAKLHKAVYENQRAMVVEHLKVVKAGIQGPQADVQHKIIDGMIADFSGDTFIFPGAEGSVRVTRQQAENLAGGPEALKQFYTDEQIKEHFQ